MTPEQQEQQQRVQELGKRIKRWFLFSFLGLMALGFASPLIFQWFMFNSSGGAMQVSIDSDGVVIGGDELDHPTGANDPMKQIVRLMRDGVKDPEAYNALVRKMPQWSLSTEGEYAVASRSIPGLFAETVAVKFDSDDNRLEVSAQVSPDAETSEGSVTVSLSLGKTTRSKRISYGLQLPGAVDPATLTHSVDGEVVTVRARMID
ncbi:Hsp20/alpha crystallin family protein [Magnetofaba australis]|uniref:Uncharacterized protein n=1 Tax=Magnetofaba australis IT-1 TaxID=1434232 RepID=A0A1Y2K8E4_9PROT|nr:Hsp20/alpha crystallin family protein [Magnetofaba australis]OSM06777.1 hypothetical protein MAIT1_00361 [Magnetofaba australis IT-1]